jgi:hypothetical protein
VGGNHANHQKGEIMVAAEALQRAPLDQPLRITCQNQQIIENLTSKLRTLEDKEWSNTKHGAEFRSAASWARRRRGKTYFRLEKTTRNIHVEAEMRAKIE